jgi:disulfide bond formation protein DsbB
MPVVLAFLFSVAAVAGSLYLSLGLGLVACPLCFYQRTFAFALVGVLGVGLLVPGRRPGEPCLLALPLAIGGLGVAGFHTLLVTEGKLECPLGIADLGPAPLQSLTAFALITLAVVVGVVNEVRTDRRMIPAAIVAFVLGCGAVYGSIVANPKLSDPPKQPYGADQPLITCRPPYRG